MKVESAPLLITPSTTRYFTDAAITAGLYGFLHPVTIKLKINTPYIFIFLISKKTVVLWFLLLYNLRTRAWCQGTLSLQELHLAQLQHLSVFQTSRWVS